MSREHLSAASRQVRAFLGCEDGQDTFEYMLIIGGVAVAAVVAIAVLVVSVPDLRSATCAAIATIPQYSSFSC